MMANRHVIASTRPRSIIFKKGTYRRQKKRKRKKNTRLGGSPIWGVVWRLEAATGVAPDISAPQTSAHELEAVGSEKCNWENVLCGLSTWLWLQTDALSEQMLSKERNVTEICIRCAQVARDDDTHKCKYKCEFKYIMLTTVGLVCTQTLWTLLVCFQVCN